MSSSDVNTAIKNLKNAMSDVVDFERALTVLTDGEKNSREVAGLAKKIDPDCSVIRSYAARTDGSPEYKVEIRASQMMFERDLISELVKGLDMPLLINVYPPGSMSFDFGNAVQILDYCDGLLDKPEINFPEWVV